MDSFVAQTVSALVRSHAEGIDSGAEMVEKRLYPALRALEHEYVKAEISTEARLPTALALAIINVLKYLPRP